MKLLALFRKPLFKLGVIKEALNDDAKFGTTEAWIKRRDHSISEWANGLRYDNEEPQPLSKPAKGAKRSVNYYDARALMEMLLVKRFRDAGLSLETSCKYAWLVTAFAGRHIEWIDLERFSANGYKLDPTHGMRLAVTIGESDPEIFKVNDAGQFERMIRATEGKEVLTIDIRPILEATCNALVQHTSLKDLLPGPDEAASMLTTMDRRDDQLSAKLEEKQAKK